MGMSNSNFIILLKSVEKLRAFTCAKRLVPSVVTPWVQRGESSCNERYQNLKGGRAFWANLFGKW